jgi:hypothetical protein
LRRMNIAIADLPTKTPSMPELSGAGEWFGVEKVCVPLSHCKIIC